MGDTASMRLPGGSQDSTAPLLGSTWLSGKLQGKRASGDRDPGGEGRRREEKGLGGRRKFSRSVCAERGGWWNSAQEAGEEGDCPGGELPSETRAPRTGISGINPSPPEAFCILLWADLYPL